MSNKMLNKIMGIMGFEDEYEEEYEEVENVEETENEEPILAATSKKSSKVVPIHVGNSSQKVTLLKPESYDEATNIVDDLKNRKIVVFNTNDLETRIAQKLLDFVAGASYSLGGDLCEVEKGVYIVSPPNVEVANELKNELTSKGLFGWSK